MKHRTLVVIELKPDATPEHLGMTITHVSGGKGGNHPSYQVLHGTGNTGPLAVSLEYSLIPIKKPNSNDYGPVHDIREVNHRVTDTCPTVSNP